MAGNTGEHSPAQWEEERRRTSGYNPETFREKGLDAGSGNDVILSGYQDLNTVPGHGPITIMQMGTAGQGLWERSWSRLAAPNGTDHREPGDQRMSRDVLGPMRAMCFARDVAEIYWNQIERMGIDAFRLTEEGQNERRIPGQQSRDECGDLGIEWTGDRGETDTPMTRFAERHPRWEDRYRALEQIAGDTQETGEHLVMIGIMDHDERMVAGGRRIMDDSVGMLEMCIEDDAAGNHVLDQFGNQHPGGPQDTGPDNPRDAAREMARQRTEYVKTIAAACGKKNVGTEREVSRFIAEKVVVRDSGAPGECGVSVLPERGKGNQNAGNKRQNLQGPGPIPDRLRHECNGGVR